MFWLSWGRVARGQLFCHPLSKLRTILIRRIDKKTSIDEGLKLLREATELLSGSLSVNIPLVNSASIPNPNRSERIDSNLRALFSTYDDSPFSSRRPAPRNIEIKLQVRQKRKEDMLSCFSSLGKHGHLNFYVCRTVDKRLLFFFFFFFLSRALDGIWRENRGSVTKLKWKLQCTLSSTIPASKHPSITLYRQSSRYFPWSRVSESPFPDSNCLKIFNNMLRRAFLAATWRSTLSAILTADGRKWQVSISYISMVYRDIDSYSVPRLSYLGTLQGVSKVGSDCKLYFAQSI